MASIVIRRLEEGTKKRLRMRASQHGRSMEEEARVILKSALSRREQEETNLVQSIRLRFASLGGVELPEVPRGAIRRPPKIGK